MSETYSPRSWQVEHDERPLPANAYRVLHWRKRAAYDKAWRNAFGWRARQARVPKLAAAIVTVVQTCREGTTLPDVAACAETVKAAVDGLVDVGVIPNDDPKHLLAITFVAPSHADKDRLVLIVEEAIVADREV